MLFIFLTIIMLVYFIVGYVSFWLGAKITGLKPSLKSILVPVIAVTAVGGVVAGLDHFVRMGATSIALGLAGIFIQAFVWEQLIKRSHASTTGKRLGSFAIGFILSLPIMFLVSITTISFVQSYEISGNSMAPALNDKDRVLVFKARQDFNKGAVVVFDYKMVHRIGQSPDNPDTGRTFGRIHGIPGETVTSGHTYFLPNGLSHESAVYTLKSDEYYVAADNSEVAYGYIVKVDSIVGEIGPTLMKSR